MPRLIPFGRNHHYRYNVSMSSLYRKHRPMDWGEVAGQAHIVSVLEVEVKKEQPSHAYLFAGSRGTGKTTIARIFAKNIGTAPEDIYEIDAASNTSVEDIRLLNEAVYTLPLNSKFKVYILDEVHMLSKSAFNAFLKTLEEPPRHVIFILATTELHKIPETILSRCQVFYFSKPGLPILQDIVLSVAKKEGVEIAPDAAELIAMVGNGSFRDTLSALQTVVGLVQGEGDGSDSGDKSDGAKKSSEASEKKNEAKKFATKGGTISKVMVEEILGLPSHMLVEQFIDSLLKKNLENGLSVLKTVHSSNLDVKIFNAQITSALRDVVLGGVGSGVSASHGSSAGSDMGTKSALLIPMLENLIIANDQIGKTQISVLPLELALLKFFGVK